MIHNDAPVERVLFEGKWLPFNRSRESSMQLSRTQYQEKLNDPNQINYTTNLNKNEWTSV